MLENGTNVSVTTIYPLINATRLRQDPLYAKNVVFILNLLTMGKIHVYAVVVYSFFTIFTNKLFERDFKGIGRYRLICFFVKNILQNQIIGPKNLKQYSGTKTMKKIFTIDTVHNLDSPFIH